MKKNQQVFAIFKKIYGLLERRQKQAFALILLVMAVSAALTQFTPKAIGWLTDDILQQNSLDFLKIVPILCAILVVTVVNELLKVGRRLLVEDTATKLEKKARGLVIVSLLRAPLAFFKETMTGNIHGRLNRCLDGTVKLEKLLFMDLAPAIFKQCGRRSGDRHHPAAGAGPAHAAGGPHWYRHCIPPNQHPAGHPGGAAGNQGGHGRLHRGAAKRD